MIVSKNSTYFFAKKESGGKGFNLYVMSQAGIPVPEWIVIGKSYFQEALGSQDLGNSLKSILGDLQGGGISAVQAESQIAQLFEKFQPTENLVKSIREGLSVLGVNSVISVRSSASDEDSHAHSFAGQLSSFLYVSGEKDIMNYVKKCWASAFSERGLIYRKENGLSIDNISVAVVLQKMIDPEKSGVMFTCDPIEKKLVPFLISAVYGVGEGLVSGALDADSFWIQPDTHEILKQELVEKIQMMKKSKSGECELVHVASDLQNVASLSTPELKELTEMGQRIQNVYQRPQDIEWAMQNGQLFILQTRPVTTLNQDLIGYPNLWDNSNIIESYGGQTLPLSFSFALRNYKGVYVQFCEILGVPPEIIKDMDSYLSYMLGSINGRVYYNLFNWYKLVGVLPGFKQNRQFMETMMGVSEELSPEIANRIRPHESWDTLSGKFRKFITGLNFFKYHFTINSVVADFLKTFHRDYDIYRKMPLKQMRGDQLLQVYFEIERNMLGRWKAPIINDFLCMVHFGLLRQLTLSWLSDLDGSIQNDLLAGEGGLESAEPTKAILRLAHVASKSEDISRMIKEIPSEDLLEALNQSAHKEFYQMILQYLDLFGFRCMSEMKLEEIDLLSDPSYLFTVLKNYLRGGNVELHDDTKEKDMRRNAEVSVRKHLRGFRKIIYFWVLKHARRAVKNRENTRFARTRAYGIARTIFQAMGEDLASLEVIDNARDIFWLTIEEVFGLYNGTLPAPDLKDFVGTRKASYEKVKDQEPDARIMTRGVVYSHNVFQKEIEVSSEDLGEFDLKGLPCCPGVVEGVVKVIINPGDDLELNGEILVTARTDPGWVPLYPSISGLLVERGSLLSHSAIVAREMGIPAIVSVPGLIKKLKTGMRIRLDGKAGTVKII